MLVCMLGDGSTTSVTTDISIPANTTIAINGPVFIGSDTKASGGVSATLTLGAGVRVFGASSTGTATATDDYIVISRGSQIEAIGTASNPIRLTARAAINDEEVGSNLITATSTALWGGLVINGYAPINACDSGTATGGSADCEKSGEGASGFFGGDDANDNSGTLQYLTVEYAGARLTNEDELNGIAFQGVGSGTTVDHIQVHNNLDDGIEWFGGTVNVKYLAVSGAGDDSVDWTDGWTGRLQYVAVRSNNPSSSDPRGIEADNLNGANAATPFSDPKIANFTMVGSTGNQQSILLRRGTRATIINGVTTGYGSGIDIDDTQTFTNFGDGSLVLQSIALDNGVNFEADGDGVPAFAAASNVRAVNNSLSNEFFPGSVELGIPVSTALSADSFFTATPYIGAFSAAETPSSNWASFTTPGTFFDIDEAACPSGTSQNGTLDGKKLCEIDGSEAITNDLHLTDGDQLVYELVGPVFIGVDRGPDPAAPLAGSASATLTIDAGVTIVGEGNDDYLVVTRGSKILSNGTAAAPVVFTAKGDIDGTAPIDADTKGLWGGVVINGRAPINACEDGTAIGGSVDCEKSGEGSSGLFGGGTSNDDSGQLFYTRVQYAGVRLTNEDELNGVAFQGVGSGTEVDFVQVYNNLDDCYEFFGGTVNVKHVLSTGCGDDQFDWTDGWVGSAQYIIASGGRSSATGGMSSDPNGFEGDNLNGANSATPVSTPRISNFTLIAGGDPAEQIGAKLRRGMAGTVANGIVLGWAQFGLDVDDTQTIANTDAGTADASAAGALVIRSLFLSDNGADLANEAAEPTFTAANDFALGDPITMSGFAFRAGRPGVVPGANENAVPVFDVTGIGSLEPTTYIGAVADADDTWFLGWSIDQTGALTSAN
ncbi:putative lipoprotein [Hyphomonas johnsonii MHS-2]|uniref:Putative lipoprotein n=1 Tax=Hyphomonas johnsonii MHS-2 TaxID=1280950 RepID=A0A059FUW9_9PROT|nr:putative lipoprotein [Hyphomonas johnsonii MHS-2]